MTFMEEEMLLADKSPVPGIYFCNSQYIFEPWKSLQVW